MIEILVLSLCIGGAAALNESIQRDRVKGTTSKEESQTVYTMVWK